ncbi:MAG: adenylate/guanylate cyclase domain-containing protein [Actinobacteria bacterium]|nr:adenylate/guanylate cyclase domain-containing protein [Actinomycetota bacterium]
MSALAGRVRGVRAQLVVAVVGTNLAMATIGFLSNFVAPAVLPQVPRPVQVLTFVAITVVAVPLEVAYVTWLTRPVADWARTREPMPADTARSVLSLPWRLAKASSIAWTIAAALFGGLGLAMDASFGDALRADTAVFAAGLTTAALVYLVTERVARPLTTLALDAHPDIGGSRVGVAPRIILAWVFAAVIPAVSLVILLLGRPVDDVIALVDLLPLFGIVWGGFTFVLVVATSRSVAAPLTRVRQAMSEVEAGSLDVEVTLDDASEIGELQAGFNRMITGLRERRRLEDLFGRHVGAEVARRALDRGVELGGERAEATALFVDVVASTAFAERHSPEEVVARLNDFFGIVVSSAASEGGWVNKFAGDGALCVFGPPEGGTDHAERGLRAARRMAEALASGPLAEAGLSAAIGVSTGEVVAGNVGTEDRYEFTVIGDPVNEAARLCEVAKERPGCVLASSRSVERAAGERDRWSPAGTEQLRGRSAPTPVHVPSAAAPDGAQMARSAGRSATGNG